uniref:Uncharacterized protein n=1 Tax=Aegilops tauschii subsp. strangulata TaxID=200361 RepID=A0A453H069_AEGTS
FCTVSHIVFLLNYFALTRHMRVSAASALGMRTPVAYKARRRASRETLARGMNFAVGGAGVLDTGNFQRNISAQIDLFQTMHHSPGCRAGSGKRTALVVVSGNDYAYAADKDNGT